GPASYALGWRVSPYRGHPLVFHGGATRGFTAVLAMLPEQRAAVVALCNLDDSRLPAAIAYTAFDRLLGVEPAPWPQRMLSQSASEAPRPPPPTLQKLGTT